MNIHQHISKGVIILLLLSGLGVTVASQIPRQYIRKARFQDDFDTLRSRLTHDYPSGCRYNSKSRMITLFDSCYSTINDTTNQVTFFTMLKFLLSQIKDGHLSCSPSPLFKEDLGKRQAYFPFRPRFINKKAYIYISLNTNLSPGTEILAINNLPIDQITNRLFQYIVSDGNIETKKYHVLGNYFYIYYFLGFGKQASFDISYKTPNGSMGTQPLEPVLESAIPPIEEDPPSPFDRPKPKATAVRLLRAIPPSPGLRRASTKENNLLNLSITPNHIAVLTIQHSIKQPSTKLDLILSNSSNRLTSIRDQQIKKLVIDLRNNGGGRDLYGSLLYSYLSPGKFQYYKSLVTATNQLPYDQYTHNTSSFNDLTPAQLEKTPAGAFQLKKEAHNNLQLISPSPNNYTGEVWFLVDGLSFSVTAEFCAIARSHHRGKFIGEETGGAYAGNTSGVQTELLLPYTQFRVSFGSIQYNMAVRPDK
jgi:hypothetical protein